MVRLRASADLREMCCCLVRLSQVLDMYTGICISVVYMLYFSVVRGALSVFNCVTTSNGVRVLVASPSVVCGQVGPLRPNRASPFFCEGEGG